MNTGDQFRTVFHQHLDKMGPNSDLKRAALNRDMNGWTMALTNLIAECCRDIGWSCAARWNPDPVLPQVQKEFFTLDLCAFPSTRSGWQFPIATMELENMASKKKIAYCMWKLLTVTSKLRCLFCYRERGDQRDALIQYLRDELLAALLPEERERISGETLLCIGTREDAEYFPFGFFRWWSLNLNTNRFEVI